MRGRRTRHARLRRAQRLAWCLRLRPWEKGVPFRPADTNSAEPRRAEPSRAEPSRAGTALCCWVRSTRLRESPAGRHAARRQSDPRAAAAGPRRSAGATQHRAGAADDPPWPAARARCAGRGSGPVCGLTDTSHHVRHASHAGFLALLCAPARPHASTPSVRANADSACRHRVRACARAHSSVHALGRIHPRRHTYIHR